jgi:hypothetical protein
MHRKSYAVLIFLLPLSLGCPKRIVFGPEGEISDARTLLSLTDQVEARAAAVKGEGKLKISSPKGGGTVGLFVAAARPALLHLETLDFFGRPQSVLVCNGKRFALLSTQEGKFYEGPASPQNVSRFLPIVLPPEELVDLLLGQVPRLPDPAPVLALDRKAGEYRVTLHAASATQELRIDPRFHRVLVSDVTGVESYDATTSGFDEASPSAFPHRIGLKVPSAAAALELQYKDVEVNEPVDSSLFTLEPPPNVPRVEVDERGFALPAAPPP